MLAIFPIKFEPINCVLSLSHTDYYPWPLPFFLLSSQDNRRSILGLAAAVYDGDSSGGEARRYQDNYKGGCAVNFLCATLNVNLCVKICLDWWKGKGLKGVYTAVSGCGFTE